MEQVTRFAEMFAAMGTEWRLRIMQLLLSAHPDGMVVGEIQEELGLSASNLSHHLDKLKNEELVTVTREGTFLRCTASALAQLNPGEIVLDLGSGGGIDVLLSARRVGPTGKAYGLDMTNEMLSLANSNKAKAGLENVEFLKGQIESI